MLSDKKILVKIHRNSLADFFKKLDILIKNQTHHKGKLPNDVSISIEMRCAIKMTVWMTFQSCEARILITYGEFYCGRKNII